MSGCETPEWLGVIRVLVIFACGVFVGAFFMRSFDKER